jgi:hypothetical protein
MENLLPNQYIIKQLAKCQFNAKYYDYESKAEVDYNCDSKDEDILASGLCIFDDENYNFLGIPQPSSMSYLMAHATMTQECKPLSSLPNTLPVLEADHY